MLVLSLAFRYATGRMVNYIACLTIALCVLVQVVVMSVLDGILEDLHRRVRALGEQITISMPGGVATQEFYTMLEDRVAGVDGVRLVTPVLEMYAAISGPGGKTPAILRGIDIEAEKKTGGLAEFMLDIRESEFAWMVPPHAERDPAKPGIFLGSRLAESIFAQPGDTVTIEFMRPGDRKLSRRRFQVCSRYRSGTPYDEYLAYISLPAAQGLYSTNEQVKAVSTAAVWIEDSSRSMRLKDPVVEAANRAAREAGLRSITAVTSEERYRTWFQGVAHENALQEVVMFFIALSGGFCIFAIMYTLVAARVRDIGILRAVGASRPSITAIFFLAGLMIGLAGSVLGAGGGVFLAPRVDQVWKAVTGEPLYPPYMFGIEGLPVLIRWGKVVAYGLGGMLMAVIASLPPAVWAARREPLEAIRHE